MKLGVEGENIKDVDPSRINRFWTRFYDEGVPHTIDYPKMPVHGIIDGAAAKHGNRIAMVFFGSEITYGQVKDASHRVAGFLKNIGVEKGDRIVVSLPNTPHYPMITSGISRVGAVVVQCNPLYTTNELKYLFENSGATRMFCLDLMFPKVLPLIEDGVVEDVVVCSIQDFTGGNPEVPDVKGVFGWGDVMKREKFDEKVDIDPINDVTMLQYTGGTTGVPKGVMLTHHNLVVNAHQSAFWDPKSSPNDVGIGVLPVFHVYGMTMGNAAAIIGMKGIPIPDPRNWDMLLATIHTYRVTVFMGVPTMFAAILNHPNLEKYDLSSLRVCNSGAAPLPVEIKKRWEEVVGVKLNEGYGLSEASPVTHVNPIYGYSKAGSIGVPVPDTIAVVVDDDGYILPPGEVGELAIFGPQVMKGYWKMEEETKKVLINGWLLTGDMAKMDEDGYFYIVDRKKDMIIAGGYNIYPREVEDVLYEHPAVLEAAVVGVPDPYRGETVKAFVVLKPEYKGKVTEKELDRHCRERLAPYKVPRIYEFRDELPKSLVGKVLRRALREEEMRKRG